MEKPEPAITLPLMVVENIVGLADHVQDVLISEGERESLNIARREIAKIRRLKGIR